MIDARGFNVNSLKSLIIKYQCILVNVYQLAEYYNVTTRQVRNWSSFGCPKYGRGIWDLNSVINWKKNRPIEVFKNNIIRKKENRHNITCLNCKKSFLKLPSEKIKYCSSMCRKEHKKPYSGKYKTCPVCNKELTKIEISRARRSWRHKTATVGYCESCFGKERKKQKSETKQNTEREQLIKHGLSKCSECRNIKKIDQFYIDKKSGAPHYKCIKCTRKHFDSLPSEISKEARERQNRSRRKLTRTDPKYRLNQTLSCQIRKALKGNKAGRSWEKLVGYTVRDLIKHLEKLFKPGMSWENYASYWNIDHIFPKSAFNYEKPEDPDFRECWALKNLRPLECEKNFSKNDTLPALLQTSFILPT